MWAGIWQLLKALPAIISAVKSIIQFAGEMAEKKKAEDLKKLKEQIDAAETEDDFRNAVDGLSKSGRN